MIGLAKKKKDIKIVVLHLYIQIHCLFGDINNKKTCSLDIVYKIKILSLANCIVFEGFRLVY